MTLRLDIAERARDFGMPVAKLMSAAGKTLPKEKPMTEPTNKRLWDVFFDVQGEYGEWGPGVWARETVTAAEAIAEVTAALAPFACVNMRAYPYERPRPRWIAGYQECEGGFRYAVYQADEPRNSIYGHQVDTDISIAIARAHTKRASLELKSRPPDCMVIDGRVVYPGDKTNEIAVGGDCEIDWSKTNA